MISGEMLSKEGASFIFSPARRKLVYTLGSRDIALDARERFIRNSWKEKAFKEEEGEVVKASGEVEKKKEIKLVCEKLILEANSLNPSLTLAISSGELGDRELLIRDSYLVKELEKLNAREELEYTSEVEKEKHNKANKLKRDLKEIRERSYIASKIKNNIKLGLDSLALEDKDIALYKKYFKEEDEELYVSKIVKLVNAIFLEKEDKIKNEELEKERINNMSEKERAIYKEEKAKRNMELEKAISKWRRYSRIHNKHQINENLKLDSKMKNLAKFLHGELASIPITRRSIKEVIRKGNKNTSSRYTKKGARRREIRRARDKLNKIVNKYSGEDKKILSLVKESYLDLLEGVNPQEIRAILKEIKEELDFSRKAIYKESKKGESKTSLVEMLDKINRRYSSRRVGATILSSKEIVEKINEL